MEKGVKKIYNIERSLYLKRIPVLPKLFKMLIRVICSASIPYTCQIGKDTSFPHGGQGVVLHDEAVIGDRCLIQCNVVIGGRGGKPGAPKIGDDVLIGAGAVVLGDITIGNNVAIGANAVVLKSVPDNAVVVGIPGKIIKYLKDGESSKGC